MKAKQRSVTDQKPNAWIVNPKDRGRKSIKSDNKVYLKDGQNFEIELFNPLQESVLAEIKVNGKSVSSTGIVLRPAERFYLDCFVDDRKKFVFKTYMVEDTEETSLATSSNGLVEVFFYKEETLQLNNWREKFTPVIERHYYPVWYPWYQPYWYYGSPTVTIGYPHVYGSTIGCYGYTTINNLSGGTTTTNLTLNGGSTTTTAVYSNTNIQNCSYTSNSVGSLLNGNNQGNYTLADYAQNLKTKETGRIEKGESSSQKFEEVDMQFEHYHISSIVYQLFPESQKPVETKEIKQEVNNFCPQCGRKLNGNENFCPQCGTKLKTVDVVLV